MAADELLPPGGGLPGLPPPPQRMHTITDKVTATTFAVVKGRIPAELLAGLESDFTSEEIEHIFARINKTLAQPPTGQPMALWVFGPSAVGKSTLGNAKAIELFGYVQNAVMIDGGEFRLHHAGFQAVTLHGQEHGLLHADAWPTFKNAPPDVLEVVYKKLADGSYAHYVDDE